MIPAGKLRHLVTIQQKDVTARDAVGGEIKDWITLATVRADVAPIAGREYVAMQQAQAEITLRVKMHYRADVTSAMRVLWDEQTYGIVEAINVQGRYRELELLCRGEAN